MHQAKRYEVHRAHFCSDQKTAFQSITIVDPSQEEATKTTLYKLLRDIGGLAYVEVIPEYNIKKSRSYISSSCIFSFSQTEFETLDAIIKGTPVRFETSQSTRQDYVLISAATYATWVKDTFQNIRCEISKHDLS